jgi:GT2 family glycosyltransferase
VAEEINNYPTTDLIYSDSDLIDDHGRRHKPDFKSDWNPDLFYSLNLISHLGVYRRSIIEGIGGFRTGYEGSQDYDLALRVVERIPEKNIRHIPHVLYHWRTITGSIALDAREKEYAHDAARKAIGEHFERKNISATATKGYLSFHRIVYTLPRLLPLVSLIITTRDRVDLLRQCVEGILEETDYRPLELLIVDNQSAEPATLKYLSAIANDPRVKVLRYDAPFNYSAMNNMAAQHSAGEIIGLINNDIKIISPDWLTEMVSHALRPEIGAVGAKLYYADDSIQHAGIITGYGGTAVNAYQRVQQQTARHIIRANVIQNFTAVTAACMVLRKQVFEEACGLDAQNLPVAFNDVDFCLRLGERGYRILWTPHAELYHLESASLGLGTAPARLPQFMKETAYLKSRWGHLLPFDPYYNINLTLDGELFSLALPPRASKPWSS